MANTLRFITMTVNMPASVKDKMQDDADRRGVTIGTVAREILAKHYGVTGINLVAAKGGARAGAGRKPLPVVGAIPSLAFIPIRRD